MAKWVLAMLLISSTGWGQSSSGKDDVLKRVTGLQLEINGLGKWMSTMSDTLNAEEDLIKSQNESILQLMEKVKTLEEEMVSVEKNQRMSLRTENGNLSRPSHGLL